MGVENYNPEREANMQLDVIKRLDMAIYKLQGVEFPKDYKPVRLANYNLDVLFRLDALIEEIGGGGGVTIHNDLTGRSEPDCHPITSITGLNEILTAIDNQMVYPCGGEVEITEFAESNVINVVEDIDEMNVVLSYDFNENRKVTSFLIRNLTENPTKVTFAGAPFFWKGDASDIEVKSGEIKEISFQPFPDVTKDNEIVFRGITG